MIQPTKIKTPRVRTAKDRLGNIGRIKAPAKAKIKPLRLREGGNVSRETKGGADELTLLLARQGEVSRGQAFQAARRLGLAEFDWKDPETGKLGRFHTRMAGEPDPSAQRGLKLPKGMKESDLYRDSAKEQPMRDSEARQRAIEAEYQQNLRNIRSEFETADKRDLQRYTSDMAPFERDQELQGEAARDLENLRAYEAREAAEAALQEAEEPGRVQRHNEIQQLRALQNQLQQEVYRNEQTALQREIDENEQKVLQEWAAGKRKEQALERVYPEALAPVGRAAISTGQGLARVIDRLFRGRPKASGREEPDIQTYPPVQEFAKGGEAAVSMTRSVDRGPRTNVLADKGLSALDLMKGMKAGEAPKTQDTARAQLDDVLRQLKLRERSVQSAMKGLGRDTFGAATLEQPTLTQGSLTKRRFAEGGDVSRETMSPEEQPVTEESSASKVLKRLMEPVREGAKGFLGMDPAEPMNPSEAYKAMQALGNMPGPAVVKGAAKAAMQVPGLLEGITTSIFIGPRAARWNKTTNEAAQAMEKAGSSPEEIWSKTMNFRAPDGQWRQEISDAGAVLKQGVAQGPLSMQMKHPELYENYPDLRDVPVKRDVTAKTSSYSPIDDSMILSESGSRRVESPLHETMHAIQTREGFSGGGNPTLAFANQQAFDILKKKKQELSTPLTLEEYSKNAWQTDVPTPESTKAYQDYLKYMKSAEAKKQIDRQAQESAAQEYYMRLHGEAEARAVAERQPLDMEQRRQLFPLQSYTRDGRIIPPQDLIIKRKEGGPVNKHDAFIKAKA